MVNWIWVPEGAGRSSRLGKLRLVSAERSFIGRSIARHGLRSWQAPTTAGLLAAWELCDVVRFMDVGASIGLYSWLCKRLYPDSEVIALEPTPEIVAIGEATSAANGLEVVYEQAAASDSVGEATLYLSSSTDASNSLVEGFRTAADVLTVTCTTLDTLAKDRFSPTVLKLDVEGHEPAVLRGAEHILTHDRPIVVVELLADTNTGHLRDSAADTRRILEAHGYDGRQLETPPGVLGREPPERLHDWIFWPERVPESFASSFVSWSEAVDLCGQPDIQP